MKVYIGRVKGPEGGASHIIEVDDEATGRVKFHFLRFTYSLKTEAKDFPFPHMKAATFKEQLRALNRAYTVTHVLEEQYKDFIEIMLRDAYGDHVTIKVKDVTEED